MSKQPSSSSTGLSNTQLDSLLEQHTVQPPADFVAQVMLAIDEQETPLTPTAEHGKTAPQLTGLTWWQWLALLLAGTPGMVQVSALVFSAWHISSAG